MAIIAGITMPHPPLLLPQVGHGGEKQISKTSSACREASAWMMAKKPDTLVIISPHSVIYMDSLHISSGLRASGNFLRFGAPAAGFEAEYDRELIRAILRTAHEKGLPVDTGWERDPSLDHGTMVPMYFLSQLEGWPPPLGVVRVGLSGLSFADHYRLGECISEAAEELNRRIGIVASGDLSHYVREDGPYGFRPEGPEYDQIIMDIMGRAAFGELLDMDEQFCNRAGECGQRSFLILAGSLDGQEVDARILSYEGITGVGYGVGIFQPTGANRARCFLKGGKAG